MRGSIISVVLGVLLMGPFAASAQKADPRLGAWKLNLQKSTYTPDSPPPKSSTMTMEPWEGGFKTTTDSVNAQGQTTHDEIIWKFDGKDYPVKGTTVNTTRAFRHVDDRSYDVITKVDGKVTGTTRVTVAPDGKTRTETQRAQGQSGGNIVVRDKQ